MNDEAPATRKPAADSAVRITGGADSAERVKSFLEMTGQELWDFLREMRTACDEYRVKHPDDDEKGKAV